MRAPFQPLAVLVDAIAEKWRTAEKLPVAEQSAVRDEILQSFNIGDKPELTFHGEKFLLTIKRSPGQGGVCIDIHEISRS